MDKKKTTKELQEILAHTDSVDGLDRILKEESSIRDVVTFAEFFTGLEKVQKMNRSDLIRKSGIDRTYGYQILNNQKHPSRDKIIALCLAAHLDGTELRRALICGGYSPLYAKNRRDAVIIYAVNHSFDVMETNELLDAFNETILK